MLVYLVAFIAGMLLVAAFAPLEQSWLGMACVAVLFYLWLDTKPKQGLYVGCWFGLGLFLAGVSWVYVSLHTYGGMPLWMGSLSVILFAGILSLYIGFQGYCLSVLFPIRNKSQTTHRFYRLLAMPVLWVVFEWLKGWLFTGFPWLDIGYTQTDTLLGSLAPVGGIYLVSFGVAVVSALLVLVLQRQYRLMAMVGLLFVFVLTWQLSFISWSEKEGDPLTIAVVQGDIPVQDKWQPRYRNQVINRYVSLTQQAHQTEPIDLTIWPETALPLFVQQTDNQFWRSLTPDGSSLLVGLLDNRSQGEDYNAALLYCDQRQHIYRKRHLVPFGEYLPLRFLFNWVLDYLQLPMSDFSKWQGSQPLKCDNNVNISLSICYEDAFANEVRQHLGTASVLVNISEDAWFGDSLAPHQRLQMAQMRAKELARPLIRSANTGPSVFIDETGLILAQTDQFEPQILSHTIQPMKGKTLFLRLGNWIVWLSLLLIALLFAINRKRHGLA